MSRKELFFNKSAQNNRIATLAKSFGTPGTTTDGLSVPKDVKFEEMCLQMIKETALDNQRNNLGMRR